MLKTETNTPAMEKRVRSAAHAAKLGHRNLLQADFEHGQWWITNLETGAQWSVVDANTANGFDFEQVTRGEDE